MHNRVGLTLLSNYQEAFTPQRASVIAGNVIAHNNEADSPRQETGGFGIGIGIAGGVENVIHGNLITDNVRAGVVLSHTEDLPALGNTFTGNNFRDNGVDVANTSADRAPAMSNCFENAVTAAPPALLSSCSSEKAHPAVDASALPSQDVPPGASFLDVAWPAPQPNMPAAEIAPTSPLPENVVHPELTDITVPAADFLAHLTGTS